MTLADWSEMLHRESAVLNKRRSWIIGVPDAAAEKAAEDASADASAEVYIQSTLTTTNNAHQ